MASLIRLIITILVLYLSYKVVKWLFFAEKEISQKIPDVPQSKVADDLVEDPVCHRYIPLSNALQTTETGHDLYFCSKSCLDKYKEDKGIQ